MKHNIFHHLVMVVYSEIINLVWLAVGVALSIGGLVIFNFSDRAFWELAIGGPLFLIGVSVFLFKVHEIILVIVRPKRLEVMCKFCNQTNG